MGSTVLGWGGGGMWLFCGTRGRGDGGEVVLPQRFPEGNGSDTSTTFVVNPGEERKIDFQVKTGPAYPVTFQTEGERGSLRVAVKGSTGSWFTVFAQPSRTPGEYRIDLPSGTYQLHATQQMQQRRLEGDSRVTVAGHAVSGLALHLVDTPSIPIQVTLDAATSETSTTAAGQTVPTQQPTAQNMNLFLHRTDDSDLDTQGDVRAAIQPDKSFVFQAGSGSYRLQGSNGGPWFVERATYGTTDLLTQSLTVSSGAGGETIQVLASSGFGQLGGTVRRNGVGVMGFVYFFPHEPSLTPVYLTQSNASGAYSHRLPPGSYTVVAFEHRFAGNLRDVAAAWAPGGDGDGAGHGHGQGDAGPGCADAGDGEMSPGMGKTMVKMGQQAATLMVFGLGLGLGLGRASGRPVAPAAAVPAKVVQDQRGGGECAGRIAGGALPVDGCGGGWGEQRTRAAGGHVDERWSRQSPWRRGRRRNRRHTGSSADPSRAAGCAPAGSGAGGRRIQAGRR